MSKVRLILPCAGFGTRMNMPVNLSKELLPNPETNSPLIDWHVENAKENGLDVLVVTRDEKKDLIQYCVKNNINLLVVKPEGEWTKTIAKAYQNGFNDYNVVALPDTVYYPKEALGEIAQLVKNTGNFTFGTFPVDDASKWCVTEGDAVFEKSHVLQGNYFSAIGLFGFAREAGLDLFTSLAETGTFKLPTKANHVSLDIFRDLTRTGKVSY